MLQQQDPQKVPSPELQEWWRTETQTKTFRFSLLWLVAFYLGEIGLLFLYQKLRFAVPLSPSLFFALVGFTTVFSALLVAAFPLRVGQSGIQGQNAFGGACRLRWDELDQISRFNLLGLRYLRITSKRGGWALYLPLFLNDVRGFWEQVFRFAPDDNPLRHFATRGKSNSKDS